MELEGGELVISRKETKQLIDLVKKAKSEKDILEVGNFLLNVRLKQRKRKPEYVQR